MSDKKTDPATRTAYHEAGHTVVALSLGIGVEHVSIVEDDDSVGRSLSQLREGFDPYLEEDAHEYLGKHLVVCQAGAVAEEILTGELPDLDGNDRECTSEIITRISSDPEDAEAKHQESIDKAREILRDNRPAVDAVAEQLMEHESLDATALEAILERVGFTYDAPVSPVSWSLLYEEHEQLVARRFHLLARYHESTNKGASKREIEAIAEELQRVEQQMEEIAATLWPEESDDE